MWRAQTPGKGCGINLPACSGVFAGSIEGNMEAASCPVWLGGLSVEVDEKILLDLFKTFGPIKNVVILRGNSGKSQPCGFVNFMSREVAEVAAQAVNGCDILGCVVKARGPSELLASGQSYAPGLTERIPCTDCAFYMDGLQCSLNGGECPYRHNARARQSNEVCEKWASWQCEDIECPRRHPKVVRQNTAVPRCPSHNAFKCTGECGFEDCNTHFMEVEAFQDHISRGHAKQCVPSASCAECKAVFFTREEQLRHPCLNKFSSSETAGLAADTFQPVQTHQAYVPQTDTSTADPSPVFHTPSRATSGIVHNLSEMPTSVLRKMGTFHSSLSKAQKAQAEQCHCKADGHRLTERAMGPVKEPLIACALCGDVYENSGDSLSSFDVPVNARGHKCPHSPSVHVGAAESTEAGCHKNLSAELEPIGVFWDIENCPVPRGKSAMAIVQKIRETFFNGKREVEFMCVCDISKEKKEIIEELNNAQVTVVHINATSKNAADDKLRQSLRRFAQSYPPPATVILVSGDINFAAELSDLRHRHNLGVICLHNAQAQAALLACAHEARRFDHFTAELPERNLSKLPEECGMSSELIVRNLPLGKDVPQIKFRLKKLSDNCGGKVVSVTGRVAIVRFPNAFCAARALKRMDKEDVFGSTIQVSYSMSSSSTNSVESPSRKKRAQTVDRQDDKASCSPLRPIRILGSFPRDTPKGNIAEGTSDAVNLQRTYKQTDGGQTERSNKDRERSTQIPRRDLESPDSLDSQEEPERKPGQAPPAAQMPHFVGQPSAFPNSSYAGIWPNPFYQNIMNMSAQSAGFPGITPLAPPLLGNPLTAPWIASLQSFAVIDQQRGGIDLLVTNLDQTVSEKELKKKLASVFREHCKVYSVVFQSGEGIPLRAFVKVPRLSDAQLAITKVHQQTIFGTCVNVTLATEKDKEFGFLRNKVTSILRDAPLHWLQLNKFLSNFYEQYNQAFDMNSLGLLHDLVVICGKPGNQTISLMSKSLGGIRVLVDRELFAKDVHTLLKYNKGVLPLVSFAALYWLKFDKAIAVSNKGTSLAEVLAAVPNVKISESLVVTWIKQTTTRGGSAVKLLELQRELTDLLTPRADFRLPLNVVVSEYQKCFNKKLPFDPAAYGFSSLLDLLEAIPNTVEVVEDGCENYLTLTLKTRMAVFDNNLKVLLENQPDHVITLGNLVSVYQKTFGHRCKVSNFGFSRLTDLIEALPHIAKIHGSGDQRIVSLVGKDKPFKPEKQVLMQNLSRELKELLSLCEDQQLPVGMVMARYRQHFGCHMKLGEFKSRSVEDVLQSLPGLQVVEIDDETYLTLPSKVTVQTLASNVLDLINKQEGKFVLTSRLPSMYHKSYGHKCSLSQAKLNKLTRCMGNGARIKGTGSDQVICLPTDAAKDPKVEKLETFADEVTALLMKYPGFRVARNTFPDLYAQQHGQHVKPKDFGYKNLDHLLAALPRVVEVTETGNMATLCLKRERLLKVFSREIVDLLNVQPDKSLPVRALPAVYQRHFGRLFRAESYGYTTLQQLVEELPSVVMISEAASKLQLTAVQCFAIEAHQLLTHLRGCVTLNRFAPNFQQLYGRPCKAADYGYTRIAELLAAMTHVVEIRGVGVEKIVVLIDHADVVMLGHQDVSNQAPDAAGKMNAASGSEDAAVIVEEEVEEPEQLQSNAGLKDMQDLIELKNEKARVPDDPLMAPVPDSLPEPSLTPAAPKRRSVGDLISFAGFNVELVFSPNIPSLAHPVAAAPVTSDKDSEPRVATEEGIVGENATGELSESAARLSSQHCFPGFSQDQGGVLSSAFDGTAVSSEVGSERALSPNPLQSQELNSGEKSHKKITKSKVRLAANFNFGLKQ